MSTLQFLMIMVIAAGSTGGAPSVVDAGLAQANSVRGKSLSAAPETLPSGDSDKFRTQMLGWQRERAVPSIIVERAVEKAAQTKLLISSPFGWRSDPILGTRRHHAGIDLPGPRGTDVYVTGSGKVISAGWSAGYGNLIEIEHSGGVHTRYGHLSQILVNRNSTVSQGQRIGKVGSTGRSTGAHLHYEVRVAGAPVNPLPYLGQTAPEYGVIWGSERSAVARWAGWKSSQMNVLPQSIIR
jgi:murein DD-endopeptidase MepM/ murein hydrolase activator NlpD